MTTSTLSQLRHQISTLSEPDRAELVHELISSLDNGAANSDVEQAWADEVTRRVNSVKSGEAKLISREQFQATMKARLNQL